MAQVTGMTATKINEIVDAAVVSASIDAATGVLTLQTRGGQTVTAGNVDVTSSAVDKAYPIGSIFMSTVSTNPATQLGVGTWAAWGTGRVPVGVDTTQTEFSTVQKTGGSKTHTLTEAEMPIHDHSGAPHTHPGPAHTHTIDHDHGTTVSGGLHRHTIQLNSSVGGGIESVARGSNSPDMQDFVNPIKDTSSSHTHAIPPLTGQTSGPASSGNTGGASAGNTGNAGSGNAHNNLQPYITCYMWRRTG